MRALLFAIDILPYRNRVQTSGGSLRSQQIVDQFEANGFDVIKALPSQSLLVKTQRHLLDDSGFLFFDVSNQAEIVSEVRADVVIWAWPLVAQIPIRPGNVAQSVIDLNGFQNIESAVSSGADQKDVTRSLVRRMREADVVIYGSSEQRAYWEGLYRADYSDESLPTGFILPYYMASRAEKTYSRSATDFFYVGSFLPWLNPFEGLFTLAEELANTASRLRIFASTQPQATNGKTSEMLARLSGLSNVAMEKPLSYSALYEDIGFSGVGFDVLGDSFERRFAYPIRTISYLTHGIPLIYNDFSCISDEVARSGAGWAVSQDSQALRHSIQQILGETYEQKATRSRSATRLAERIFACLPNWKKFFAHLGDRAKDRRLSRLVPARKHKPNVLVISDDEENILKLRCLAPLESLIKHGDIGGYAVVGKNGLRSTTLGPSCDSEMHSVLVQRVPQVPTIAIEELTKGRYVYDIDDNLLRAPAYRPPFPLDFSWKVRTLLEKASTITVTNAFLARSLACCSGLEIAGKMRIVPNPLLRRNFEIGTAPIGRVLFASSDELPLIDSAQEVFSAIGAFCRRRDLEFCYIGSYPNNRVFKDYLHGVRMRLLQHRPYHEYLDMLEGIDALAVVPLETVGDAATVDFVKSKSDIKAVEYLGMGRPAVFTNVAPYRYSDLPIRNLVPNERACWNAGLEAAFAERSADRATAAKEVERQRWIGGPICALWRDNLSQNALPRPLRLQRVIDTVTTTLSKLRFPAWPAESFDETFYLDRNEDVRQGLATGRVDSAYDHYKLYGHAEGRRASQFDSGRNMVEHIEESSAAILAMDAEMNRTEAQIQNLKQRLGIAS